MAPAQFVTQCVTNWKRQVDVVNTDGGEDDPPPAAPPAGEEPAPAPPYNRAYLKAIESKTAYGIDRIKARLKETSQSWIAMIVLVLNLVKLAGSIPCCPYQPAVLAQRGIPLTFGCACLSGTFWRSGGGQVRLAFARRP